MADCNIKKNWYLLYLKQLANHEGGSPTQILPPAHEAVSLHNAPCCSECQGYCQLSCCLSQYTWSKTAAISTCRS